MFNVFPWISRLPSGTIIPLPKEYQIVLRLFPFIIVIFQIIFTTIYIVSFTYMWLEVFHQY